MTRKARQRIKLAWRAREKHKRAQLLTTGAIITAAVVSYLCNYVFDAGHYAPLVGLGASMFWIWCE